MVNFAFLSLFLIHFMPTVERLEFVNNIEKLSRGNIFMNLFRGVFTVLVSALIRAFSDLRWFCISFSLVNSSESVLICFFGYE